MTTSIDIVIYYDSSLLMKFYEEQIRKTIRMMFEHIPSNQIRIRMCLIEFQSHTNDHLIREHAFQTSKDDFFRLIDDVLTESITEKECKAIANAFNECFTLEWQSNINEYDDCEKLVILFTDGPPCNLFNNECCTNGHDLWLIAEEFNRKDINLVVIGLGPSITICEDFYCALARKTGGEYIPLVNAGHVLSSVIRDKYFEHDSFRTLFRGLNMHFDIEYGSEYKFSYCERRVNFMLTDCHTMNDIRKQLFTFRRTNAFDNNDYFEIDSTETYSFNEPYEFEKRTAMSSTPIMINDDEGYRTRLPTSASINSNVNSIVNSLVSDDDADLIILQWSD